MNSQGRKPLESVPLRSLSPEGAPQCLVAPRLCSLLLLLALCCLPAQARTLSVAVTLTDLVPLVQAIGGDAVTVTCVAPAGGDPHSFTITAEMAQLLRRADLIVFASTPYLEFETDIKHSLPDANCADWPDYVAQGAKLNDVPGIPGNPHGLWLNLDNGIAIARAVAAKLQALAPDNRTFAGNCARFVAEVQAAEATGKALAEANGVAGQTLVPVVPGLADCVLNVGMRVGKVLLPTEGASFASAQDIMQVSAKLRSGEWHGLVCALNATEAKPGEIARQVAKDTGSRVIYVRFLAPPQENSSYLAQAYYNAAALTAKPPEGTVSSAREPPGSASFLTAAAVGGPAIVIILLLSIALLRAKRAARTALPGAGIFDDVERGEREP